MSYRDYDNPRKEARTPVRKLIARGVMLVFMAMAAVYAVYVFYQIAVLNPDAAMWFAAWVVAIVVVWWTITNL